MNKHSRLRVRVAGGISDTTEVSIELHQGSGLSSFFHIIVMEKATKDCRTWGSWELQYAGDLILPAETKRETYQLEASIGEKKFAGEYGQSKDNE